MLISCGDDHRVAFVAGDAPLAALFNAGAIRSEIAAGDVSRSALNMLLPYLAALPLLAAATGAKPRRRAGSPQTSRSNASGVKSPGFARQGKPNTKLAVGTNRHVMAVRRARLNEMDEMRACLARGVELVERRDLVALLRGRLDEQVVGFEDVPLRAPAVEVATSECVLRLRVTLLGGQLEEPHAHAELRRAQALRLLADHQLVHRLEERRERGLRLER